MHTWRSTSYGPQELPTIICGGHKGFVSELASQGTHSQALAHNYGHDSIRPGTLPVALEAWDVQLGGLGHHPVRKTPCRAAIEQPFVCASPVRTRAIALQRSCCDRRLCRRHVPQTLSVDNLDWLRAEMRHHNFENIAFGTPQDMAEYIGKPSLMCSARLVVQRTPLGMSPTPCPPTQTQSWWIETAHSVGSTPVRSDSVWFQDHDCGPMRTWAILLRMPSQYFGRAIRGMRRGKVGWRFAEGGVAMFGVHREFMAPSSLHIFMVLNVFALV